MKQPDSSQQSAAHRSVSRVDSFRHAFAGWGHLFRTQRNAWIHCAFSLAVIAVGLWLRLSALEWALIVAAMGLVWVSEFINTALEAVVDLASPTVHPLAQIGKDVAAGGVLVAAGTAVLIGLLVLGPPLLEKVWPWMSHLWR